MKELIYFFVIAMLMSGCSVPGTYMWYGSKYQESMNIAKRNNSNMAKLSLGMLKEKVIEIMGVPDRTEAYQLDKPTELMFYRTHSCDDNLKDQDGFFTPVAIQDGKISGWGMSYYDQAIKLKYEIKNDITIKK